MDDSKYNLWKPEYAVDVDEIDTQHKKFFDYCTRLIQLADESSEDQHTNADLVSLVFKLRAYAFHHFMDEESMMLKYKYPEMIGHIREHNLYCIQILTHIESDYNIFKLNISDNMNDESRRIALFLSDFAANWLEQHIYSRDKLLGKHINKDSK